jgi:hypothetical protein
VRQPGALGCQRPPHAPVDTTTRLGAGEALEQAEPTMTSASDMATSQPPRTGILLPLPVSAWRPVRPG